MAQYRMVVSSGGHSEDDEGGAWKVSASPSEPFHLDLHCASFRIGSRTFIQGLLPVRKFALVILLECIANGVQIVKTLGYSDLKTYLIQAPPYVFAYMATLVVSWSSGKHMEHCWHIIARTVGCIVGTIIMIST
jgi:hypothetical protein